MKRPAPAGRLIVGDDEVHVWCVRLSGFRSVLGALRETLSEEERRRADRFRFARDRDDFTVARATLRAILGRYLNIEPARVEFHYGEFGKPALVRERHGNALDFNASRSGGLAIVAVAHGREIGADLERIRPGFQHLEIADRFFSPRECATLKALPIELQLEAFFRCWTRKEAYAKAKGTGMSHPLQEFSVSLAPEDPAKLLEVSGNPSEASRWSLEALAPEAGFVGAIAAEGQSWHLKWWWHPG
jgi:4'-phosphopantetheinyl transferase